MAPICFRSFAIVPAAGSSRRMGRPKLLLPWGHATLIEAVLDAWRKSRISTIVVVVRPEDSELAALCRRAGADVVVPESPPPQMRDSVQLALDYVERVHRPVAADAWLLGPADMPNLSPAIVNELLAVHQPLQPLILTPMLGSRRGHPVLFPWPLAHQVRSLPADRGIDLLVGQSPKKAVPCDRLAVSGSFLDVDTPQEYEQAKPPRPEPDRSA